VPTGVLNTVLSVVGGRARAICRRCAGPTTSRRPPAPSRSGAVTREEDPTAPAGTLEWTLPSGVTCRSHPHIAAPAPIRTSGPGAHPAVAAAAAHLAERRARQEALRAEYPNSRNLADELAATDWAGHAWQQSRTQAAQARTDQAAHDAERQAQAHQPPPF
jgi:hypothetical protein